MTYSDKIWHFIDWLLNKFGHLCVCLVIAMYSTLLFGPAIGSLAGITAGVGKECWDKWRGGSFDLWDLGADILGTILGVWVAIKLG